eukprot:1842657-Amphidinium_carterae.1
MHMPEYLSSSVRAIEKANVALKAPCLAPAAHIQRVTSGVHGCKLRTVKSTLRTACHQPAGTKMVSPQEPQKATGTSYCTYLAFSGFV